MKLFRKANIAKFLFLWITSGILFYNFSFIPSKTFCKDKKMNKCCCMNKSDVVCDVKMMSKECSCDLKGLPKKTEEKSLIMNLNSIPKFNGLFPVELIGNSNNPFYSSLKISFFSNRPENSQRVYITLSNLRI